MGDQVRRRIHTAVVDDLILLRVVEWNIRDIIPLAHKVIFNPVGIPIHWLITTELAAVDHQPVPSNGSTPLYFVGHHLVTFFYI